MGLLLLACRRIVPALRDQQSSSVNLSNYISVYNIQRETYTETNTKKQIRFINRTMQIPNVPFSAPAQTSTGNAAFFPANDDFLLQQLQQQIDFYFSPENLCRDEYLRTILYQNNGAVPVEVIASFPMIKKIVARAFLGPAAIYHTDPLTLPPPDCNLLRHAVALNSQTVLVEGMFFVHPEYRVQQNYTTAPFPHAAPQERFVPLANQHMDRHTIPLPNGTVKKSAGDDASARTAATVSPTSFASTVNPSADDDDDNKSYIAVNGIPNNASESTLKKWLAFDHRKVPEDSAPVFPLSLEKTLPETWKLSFSTESEARTAMDVISKRKFKKGGALTCHFVGGGSSTSMPVTMLYQPLVLPHGEQVYYASAYPQNILETVQKGMVATPYSASTATPMYAWAYSPTPVTSAGAPSAVGDKESCVHAPSPQEENLSPHVHQPTPDPRARRNQYRGKKLGFHSKNRKKKMDEFPPLVPLVESSETSAEKNGSRANAVLSETMQKMGEMNLNNDNKNEEKNE